MKRVTRGQTTVNKKAPIHCIITKMTRPQTPFIFFSKSPKRFHDKAVQSNVLWLNLDKIGAISILQSAHKQGNPSFHFHAPDTTNTFSLFLDEFLQNDLRPIYCSLTAGYSHPESVGGVGSDARVHRRPSVPFRRRACHPCQHTVVFSRQVLSNNHSAWS